MAYQFHFYQPPAGFSTTDARVNARASVIHRVVVPEYPGRVFSAYLDAQGALIDAEGREERNGCGARAVKRDSTQWLRLARRAAAIWKFETENAGVDGDKRKAV